MIHGLTLNVPSAGELNDTANNDSASFLAVLANALGGEPMSEPGAPHNMVATPADVAGGEDASCVCDTEPLAFPSVDVLFPSKVTSQHVGSSALLRQAGAARLAADDSVSIADEMSNDVGLIDEPQPAAQSPKGTEVASLVSDDVVMSDVEDAALLGEPQSFSRAEMLGSPLVEHDQVNHETRTGVSAGDATRVMSTTVDNIAPTNLSTVAATAESLVVPVSMVDAAAPVTSSQVTATTATQVTVSPDRLASTVMDAVRAHSGATPSRLSITLNPEQLGTIQIEVRLVDSAIEIVAAASHEAGRSAMESLLPELRQMSSTNGVRIADIMVNDSSDLPADQQPAGHDKNPGDRRHDALPRRIVSHSARQTSVPGSESHIRSADHHDGVINIKA